MYEHMCIHIHELCVCIHIRIRSNTHTHTHTHLCTHLYTAMFTYTAGPTILDGSRECCGALLSLNLSLILSPTLIFSLILFLLSLLILSLCLCPLSLTHSHFTSLTHSLTLALPHSLSFSCSVPTPPPSPPPSLARLLACLLMLSLVRASSRLSCRFLSHRRCLCLSLCLSSLSVLLSFFLYIALSLVHTQSLSCAHTHSLSHARARNPCAPHPVSHGGLVVHSLCVRICSLCVISCVCLYTGPVFPCVPGIHRRTCDVPLGVLVQQGCPARRQRLSLNSPPPPFLTEISLSHSLKSPFLSIRPCYLSLSLSVSLSLAFPLSSGLSFSFSCFLVSALSLARARACVLSLAPSLPLFLSLILPLAISPHASSSIPQLESQILILKVLILQGSLQPHPFFLASLKASAASLLQPAGQKMISIFLLFSEDEFFLIYLFIFKIHVQPTEDSEPEDLAASVARLTKEQVSLSLARFSSLARALSLARSLPHPLAHARARSLSFAVCESVGVCDCARMHVCICVYDMHACVRVYVCVGICASMRGRPNQQNPPTPYLNRIQILIRDGKHHALRKAKMNRP